MLKNYSLSLFFNSKVSNRFPFNNFTYYFTLFSKCFSSFPHGTCSLSVSRLYLALDGIYHHKNKLELHSQATRLAKVTFIIFRMPRKFNRIFTFFDVFFQRTYFLDKIQNWHALFHSTIPLFFFLIKKRDFKFELFPTSLAVTKGILVSFFSSA